ncbi:MAG: amidohydrolase [Gammaproteobacteria bacterium]|nr:amidohydrolase [Gammaproteobacteria bacterium]MYH14783.1 amidohydrolase [Gammaproteobacteria bacterium]MYK84188.1 amidohydrolase [Gammaproteobacteria bacterium]
MRTPLALLTVAALLPGCGQAPQPADLILSAGQVYTLDESRPWAEAVAIRGGRIAAVGTDEEVLSRFRGQVFELGGRMVLPGFHDAHVHPTFGGIQLMQCDLSGSASAVALTALVAGCDAALPQGDWLVGGGWELSLFPDANPSKDLLDAINADRPIFLRGADGHSSWANSKALALAGIDAETPNPPHGIIERDENGAPSGTLRESAQGLVEAIVPLLTAEDRLEATRQAVALANQFGITSMIDAATSTDEWTAWQGLDAAGGLTARVVLSIPVSSPLTWTPDESLIRTEDRGSGQRLRRDAAKLFVDGVLEGETAALLEPYLGEGGGTGMLILPADELAARVVALDAQGVQAHFHAIGDRAVRVALDAVEQAIEHNGPSDNRHHISHLQLIDPADYPRFAALNVTANFQPLWAYPDGYITDINLPAIGAERVEGMYPIGSLERAGARIAAGSDWSVSSLNPLPAIETALTRQDATGEIEGTLNANEAVSLDTMLRAYTANGAWLMHQEDQTGVIKPGMAADLVVLEKDLFSIPATEVGEVAVTMTLFEGEIVYRRPSQPQL